MPHWIFQRVVMRNKFLSWRGLFFSKLKEAGTPTPFIISQIKNIQIISRVRQCACHEPVSITVHIDSLVFNECSLNGHSCWSFVTGHSSSVADTQLRQGVHDQHTNSAKLKGAGLRVSRSICVGLHKVLDKVNLQLTHSFGTKETMINSYMVHIHHWCLIYCTLAVQDGLPNQLVHISTSSLIHWPAWSSPTDNTFGTKKWLSPGQTGWIFSISLGSQRHKREWEE